ncbi:MAG: F0F1 ATP synthase subunit A [Planctomycetota bacterium]
MIESLFTLAASNPVDHVVNHAWIVNENGVWLWSAQQTNLVIAGVICIVLGTWLAKQVGTGDEAEGNRRYLTKNPFAHMIEVIALYLRESVVRPLLHERTDRFMPYLWSLFFFVLVNNMLGLVPLLDAWFIIDNDSYKAAAAPIGGTATQSIFVTAVLATFSFFVINVAGVRELGVKGYLAHLTAGSPWYLWPLMIPIEILGSFIKPIALAIRLFANMTAGHILLATLFMFVGLALKEGGPPIFLGAPVTLISSLGAIAIYFLEIFVGFLQAFIFMFLTAVFIAQLSHHHDDDHAHEGHHTEDSAAAPATA